MDGLKGKSEAETGRNPGFYHPKYRGFGWGFRVSIVPSDQFCEVLWGWESDWPGSEEWRHSMFTWSPNLAIKLLQVPVESVVLFGGTQIY